MIAALKESKIELNVNEARQSSSPALPSWHLHRALQPSADRAMLRCEDLSKGCDVSVGGGGGGLCTRGSEAEAGSEARLGGVAVSMCENRDKTSGRAIPRRRTRFMRMMASCRSKRDLKRRCVASSDPEAESWRYSATFRRSSSGHRLRQPFRPDGSAEGPGTRCMKFLPCQEKLPAKVNLWHVSQVNDKNDAWFKLSHTFGCSIALGQHVAEECTMACAPFDGDVPFFESLQIEQLCRKSWSEGRELSQLIPAIRRRACVNAAAASDRLAGASLKCEVCFADVLQKAGNSRLVWNLLK